MIEREGKRHGSPRGFVLVFSAFVLLAGGCWGSSEPESSGRSGAGGSESGSRTAGGLRDPKSQKLVDPPRIVSAEKLNDGWIALFDGRTLFGWTPNSHTKWTVKGGAIVSDSETPGLLLTTTQFDDYELRCEVWLEPGGNSGLFLRTGISPKDPARDCLEFNLCDRHEQFPTGSLVGRAVAKTDVPIEGDWHRLHVILNGRKLTATIDDKTVLEAESSEFLQTGGRRIGLQQNEGKVRFRNLMLKPLRLNTILADESHEGWRVAPPGAELPVAKSAGGVWLLGKGYLESEATYGDFVLQFQARMNAADTNSGLFFRTQKSTAETPSNGYELQLQNTIADGDRTQPADYGDGFGTGAIFRRQAARYVNADDGEWFNITLVARGNHFASWVNGLQVTNFTDERPLDENPRRGRRDKAGHLSFQGHDAGTNISIRNVRIQETGVGQSGGSGEEA